MVYAAEAAAGDEDAALSGSAEAKKSRGITYQSRKIAAAPCVSSTVVNGTLLRIRGSRAAEIRTKRDGKPADSPLASAMTSPQTRAAIGANSTPTDAMPSVANSDALRNPSR